MKKILIIWLTLGSISSTVSAQRYYDSLWHALKYSAEDTSRVKVFYLLSTYFESTNPDSNYYYYQRTKELSEELKYPKGKFLAGVALFFSVILHANYVRALGIALSNLSNAEAIKEKQDRLYYSAYANQCIGLVKNEMRDTIGKAARDHLINDLRRASGKMDADILYGQYLGLAAKAHSRRKEDSAFEYFKSALAFAKAAPTVARF